MRSIYIPVLTLASLTIAAFTGCSSAADRSTACDADSAFAPEVREVIEAVRTDNPARFSAMVDYPLQRPYPLRDIADSAAMVEYYPILVDDSLRNAITGSKPSDWSSAGWRGITLGDGSYLWIYSKIYSVGYVGKREQALIDSLAGMEIASIHHSLRKGWKPFLCLIAPEPGYVFRVDRAAGHKKHEQPNSYRLAVYHDATHLDSIPDILLDGIMDIEGSAGVRTLIFKDKHHRKAFYCMDPAGEDDPREVTIEQPDGETKTYRVIEAYWRDLHPKR